MNTVTYNERKNYVKYDENQVLLYLNEQPAEVKNEETGEVTAGYSYTGTMPDGSTRIAASGVTDGNRRAKFISGLLGTEYDTDAQIAILANGSDTPEHAEEYKDFEESRSRVKAAVDELLSRNL